MTEYGLEEKFELSELLDLQVLAEVFTTLTEIFKIKIQIFDSKGNKVITTDENETFCKKVKNLAEGMINCQQMQDKLRDYPLKGSSAIQVQGICGLKYAVFPLIHQFDYMGRVVLGPFRDTNELSVEACEYLKKIGLNELDRMQLDYQKITSMRSEILIKVTRFLSKMLSAFIFLNAKRLLTSRMHLETIMMQRERIFKEMEQEARGTKEDEEEIKKLKDMF